MSRSNRQNLNAASARCGASSSRRITAASGPSPACRSGSQSWQSSRVDRNRRCWPSTPVRRATNAGCLSKSEAEGAIEVDRVVSSSEAAGMGDATRMTPDVRSSGSQKIFASSARRLGSIAKSQPPAPRRTGGAGVERSSNVWVFVVGAIIRVASEKLPGEARSAQVLQIIVCFWRAPVLIRHGSSRDE
jgi:hypothetical protein